MNAPRKASPITAKALARLRRSVATPLVTVVTFVLGSVPIPARAQTAALPGAGSSPANGGAPVFGFPEQGAQQATGALELANVDLATGLARSSLPFALPAARGTAQPALSLTYSSVSGQREAGVGWGLSLPAIERHNDSGPPLYRDPAVGGRLNGANDGTGEDHFTFEGRALVPICQVLGSDSNETSSCPADETMPSWAAGWHYFRLEADSSFQRFFWSPDHQTWAVQQKDGTTLELGTPMDDPSNHDGNDIDPNPQACWGCVAPATFRWRLVRQFDSMGADINVVYYVWEKDPRSTAENPQNLHYLTDVFDTPARHTSGGGTWGKTLATDTFAHHAHLTWEADDKTTPPPNGLPTPMSAVDVWRQVPTQLLSRVDVTSFGKDRSSARHLVRSYALEYYERGRSATVGYERSLLKSVQNTGACDVSEDRASQTLSKAPSCTDGVLPPTTMTYTMGSNQKMSLLSAFSGQWGPLNEPAGTLMDVNGDGLPDYVAPVFASSPEFVGEPIGLG